jgi:heme exporter protein C
MLGGLANVLVGVGLIIAAASGRVVLKGTQSAFALIAIGGLLSLFGAHRLLGPASDPRITVASADRRGPATSGIYAAVACTSILFLLSIWQIFAVAPVEAIMGVVQKIFYFHVPAAYVMYLGAIACFVGSAWYLVNGASKGDAIGQAGAEIAVAFGAIVLITGPLWARKAWGTYWTWDPRLTTTLLALLIYVAYLVLRGFGGEGETERKFAAALGILGLANLPIIHYSVRKWSGQHPTVITKGGGGLDPRMYPALFLSLAAFTALALLLLWVRARGELVARRLHDVREAAIEAGIVADEEPLS